MNQQEAQQMVALAKQMWGNNFKVTDQTIYDWAQHSGTIPVSQIKQALEAFAREGREFCPPPAVLIARAKGILGPAVYNNRETRRSECLHCGGPTPSGRSHFSWCFNGDHSQGVVMHDCERRSDLPENAHHHNPWGETAPPPPAVRAMLKEISVGKRM